MRQMRKWAMAESDQGPVYLGYRLGHIRGQSRVFRALVYNKGAAVLHMLRRLVGDDAFFKGLERFYRDVAVQEGRAPMISASPWRQETGRSLARFFERWIYGFSLPKVKFSYRVEGNDVVLHAEQMGEIFDVPLTVILQYAGDRRTERRLRVDGAHVRDTRRTVGAAARRRHQQGRWHAGRDYPWDLIDRLLQID